MTPARRIVPGQTVMITARAVSRSYRFAPLAIVVELIQFCMLAALSGFRVDVHEFCWMSNHWHVVLTDHEGRLPEVMQKIHMLISKNLNALRRTKGSNFEKGYGLSVVVDPEAIERACAYTLANPIRAGIVATAAEWLGFNSWSYNYGDTISAKKPNAGIWRRPVETRARMSVRSRKRPVAPGREARRGRSRTPDSVEVRLVRPPNFAPGLRDEEARETIRKRVREIEREVAAELSSTGRQTSGTGSALSLNWWEIPKTDDELFAAVPRVLSSTTDGRTRYLALFEAFQSAYQSARLTFVEGLRSVEFPWGTYLMRCRLRVNCAAACS